MIADAQRQPTTRGASRDLHGQVARETRRVLQHIGDRALELRGIAIECRELVAESDLKLTGADALTAAARTISSIEHQLVLGSALPACRRDRSSRFSTRRESRSASLAATEVSSSRAGSLSAPDRSSRTAAVIDVSGERRSCDTARKIAFWTASLRRSALVSMSCASSSERRFAAATSVSSAGTTRSRIASSEARSVPLGTRTVPVRSPSTTNPRVLVAIDPTQLDADRVDAVRRCDTAANRA